MISEEDKISQLESSFPALSGNVFDDARKRVLSSGGEVIEVENGCLYKVSSDNKKVRIKKVHPSVRTILGKKIKLR